MQTKLIQEGTRQIEYIDIGIGSEIILFLGGANTNFKFNERLLKQISKDFRVLSVGYPGLCKTTAPKKHEMSVYIGDIKAIIDHLNLNNFTIFGASFGGYLAAILASDPSYNNKIKKVILGSPILELKSHTIPGLLYKFIQHDFQSFKFARKLKLFPYAYAPVSVHHPIEQLKHVQMIIKLKVDDIEKAYRKLIQPTLVFLADDDHILKTKKSENLFNKLKNTVVIKLNPRLGHDAFTQIGSELNKYLLDFIVAKTSD